MMINAFRNRTLQFETQLSKEQRSFNCKYFQKHEEVKEEPESETVNHKDAEEKKKSRSHDDTEKENLLLHLHVFQMPHVRCTEPHARPLLTHVFAHPGSTCVGVHRGERVSGVAVPSHHQTRPPPLTLANG